ncbi:MAG: dimethylsulfoniopropionate demethylase [Pseudomonadota bacterium]
MSQFISVSSRLRRTPFSVGVEASGVKSYTVYNHMLLPTVFESVESDCAHLKSAVQVWDVSAERQVELNGPDAAWLLQMATPRNLGPMQDDQCYYVPLVAADGRMLNDPVAVRLGPNRFWVSIADTDAMLYFKGLASALRLNVAVFEPDVSPMAIQGPLADELASRVWGDGVRSLRFFRHMPVNVGGKTMVLARSGWSKQGGFELYLDGAEHGMEIWEQLFDLGADLGVRAGCPNQIERIEGGLLSFGSDITLYNTPFEAGLGRFVHDVPECLANQALKGLRDAARQVRPLDLDGAPVPPLKEPWPMHVDGEYAGTLRSAAWSPEFGTNVAIGMVEAAYYVPGARITVRCPDGDREAVVRGAYWR